MAPKRKKSNEKKSNKTPKQAKKQNINESNSNGLEDIENSNAKQNNTKLEPNVKFLALPKQNFTHNEINTLSPNMSNEDSVKQIGLTSKGSPNSGLQSSNTSSDQFFKTLLFGSKGITNKIQKQNPMNGHKMGAHLEQIEAELEGLENQLIELMAMRQLMPHPRSQPNLIDVGSESMCSEIVDQLRQTTNQLVEEIRESRKVAKDCAEESTKQLINSLKKMQLEFKQTFGKELKKLLNK